MELTVREVADRLGISPRRVQALVAARQLAARRVGRSFLIDAADLPRAQRRGRPLGVRMAHALTGALSGDDVDLSPTEMSRLRSRLGELFEDDEPAVRLHSWLSATADPVRRFAVSRDDIAALSADPRIVPTGISDERLGIVSGGQFEGRIAGADLDLVQREYLMAAGVDSWNVLLHVSDGKVDRPVPVGILLADLAARAGTREDSAVRRLLRTQLASGRWPMASQRDALTRRRSVPRSAAHPK